MKEIKFIKDIMKNLFLPLLVLLLIVSCSTKNNSTINESNINDTTNQTIILVNDTPRVVIDTVAVLNDDGTVEYFYTYK
jgi:uncharacterized protein YcfL